MNNGDDNDRDRTPVQPPREFLVHCYRALAAALRTYADVLDGNANVVEAGGGTEADLAGAEDDLNDLSEMAAGSGRATRRFRHVIKAKEQP